MRARADRLRSWLVPATQIIAVLLAIAAGWHGYTIARDHRLALGSATVWIFVAAGLMAYVAWDGALPHIGRWPRALGTYIREHPVELGLLVVITGMGVFVRLWRYGTLPPDGYVFFEEHIYGGVQWDILHGDRTYIYLMHNYLGALSQKVFGPNTDGLRMHSVITGIVSVPLFYLMMREATGRTGALFATAIYASLRSTGDVGPPHQTLFLAEVILIWTALRALNTRNLVWLVPASLAAAILSYEYESGKAVPLLLGAFLAWWAVRGLLWPLPRDAGAMRKRIRAHGPRVLRGIVIVAVVVIASLGPMVAETKRGRDIYFGSLDRNQADRGGGTFAPDWEEQLRWSLKVYTPWLDADYQAIGSVAAGGIIDRMTSLWLWAGVAAGVAMFWRGHRALFIGWFLSGIIMSSLLLSNWAPWKMVGWLLPAIALAGFVADDLVAITRRYGQRAIIAVSLVLAAAVGVAFTLNVRQINRNAHSTRVLKEWGNNPSYLYSICDNLRARPDDTFAITSQRQRANWGFGADIKTSEDIKKKWGDFRFVCVGLEGMATSGLAELWPIAVTEDRPYTLIQPVRPDEVDAVIDALARSMPAIGSPDERKIAPGREFDLLIWDTTREELNARQGLVLRWLGSGGETIGQEIVAPGDEPQAPAGAVQYSLSGLALAPATITAALAPTTDSAGVTITVDGHTSYAAGAPSRQPVLQGWHLVDVRGAADSALPLLLGWQADDGSVYDVAPDGMFALEDTNAWLHLRELQLGDAGPYVTQRFDYQPHVAGLDGLRVGATTPLEAGTKVLTDFYQGYWAAPKGAQYTFTIVSGSQQVELLIDGAVVIAKTAANGAVPGTASLAPGEHLVEVRFTESSGPFVGGYLYARNPDTGELFQLEVTPLPRSSAP